MDDSNIRYNNSRVFDLYAHIENKRARQKAESAYRISIEASALRMNLRCGTLFASITLNEYLNPVYFCTTGGMDFPKLLEMVATLERAKQHENTRDELWTNLQQVMGAVKGTAGNDDGNIEYFLARNGVAAACFDDGKLCDSQNSCIARLSSCLGSLWNKVPLS